MTTSLGLRGLRRNVTVRSLAVLAALAGWAGCSEPATVPEPVTPPVLGPPDTPALAIRAIDWNPTRLQLGRVAAVLEREGDQVILSDRGVFVLAGGAIAQSDTSITGYTEGGLVPAGDGAGGVWALGVDAQGALHHLRSSGLMEPVSDRYGLAGNRVRALGQPDPRTTVFVLETQLAVADGAQVARHDVGALTSVSMGGGRVAGLNAQGQVRVITLPGGATVDYALSAKGVALRPDGKLVVTTQNALYVENAAAELVLTYESPRVALGAITAVGDRAWFLVGTDLATVDADRIVRKTTAATFPATGRLVPAADGVWLFDNGDALRIGPDSALAGKVRRWEEAVRPIFLGVCAQCHLPGGVGRFNLSSYAAWLEHRDALVEQVIDTRRMPPPGNALSEADRQALGTWLNDPTR